MVVDADVQHWVPVVGVRAGENWTGPGSVNSEPIGAFLCRGWTHSVTRERSPSGRIQCPDGPLRLSGHPYQQGEDSYHGLTAISHTQRMVNRGLNLLIDGTETLI